MRTPSLLKLPKSAMAGRVLGLALLLTTAVSSGAVIGIANASSPKDARVTAQVLAAPEAPANENFEAVLAVSEPPAQTQAPAPAQAPATAAAPRAKSSTKGAAAPVLNLVIPGMAGGGADESGGGSAVKCSRFDDAKINWILDQVAKTRAEHPEMAAGADKLTAELRSALGKNMCASDAQVIINRLCDDPAVVRVLNQMVSQLPFFIKPMIGNPCTADLVSVLNKAGKFVPGLSSDPT
ncbi:MAG TPA: hypothetical protein VFV09_00975 [Actinomycetota bacterium]|jgi:hypothetical protein|nr:hypothetical protein [Actinomycetota bacterium]